MSLKMSLSELRIMSTKDLRKLPKKEIIVTSNDEPLVVLVKYSTFLQWQEVMKVLEENKS